MKKVVSIILLICLICLSCTVVKAANEPSAQTASANIKFETVTGENKVTIKISTGTFEGVNAGSVMSASMTLAYNENYVTRVSGKTTDNWKITISNETKRVLLENDKANPNTQFAEITFELKSDVTEEVKGTVSITDFNISDGASLDENYETYTANYTIKPAENNNDDDNKNPVINNETSNEVTNNEQGSNITINTNNVQGTNKESGSTVNNGKDNTITPDSKLPQTGINIFIVTVIVAILAFGIVKFVKYKDIEIK